MRRFLAGTVVLLTACGAPSPVPVNLSGSTQALVSHSGQAPGPDRPKILILRPKSMLFGSASAPPQKAYIEHFSRGEVGETCDKKGVAQVSEDGRRPQATFVYLVTPIATGHCEVLFHKGRQHRELDVLV
jgi:hypothetical protein